MFPAIQSTARPSGVASPYWITTSKLVRAGPEHTKEMGFKTVVGFHDILMLDIFKEEKKEVVIQVI